MSALSAAIPTNDATGWGDSFRSWLLAGHDVDGNTIDAISVFNVKEYGAVGDGTADDTTACQNALTAAAAGGIVFFPTGTYSVTGLSLTLGSSRVKVCGAGQSSVIKNSSTGAGSTSKCGLYVYGDRFTYEAANWVEVSDIHFTGSAAGGNGLYLDRCGQAKIDSVACSGFTSTGTWGSGIYLCGGINVTVVNPLLTLNNFGLVIDGTTYQANTNHVVGGWVEQNISKGCYITGNAHGNSFYNTIFQLNDVGCHINSGAQQTNFFGGWCEANTTYGLQLASVASLVEGMYFYKDVAYNSCVDLQIDATASNVKVVSPLAASTNLKMTVAAGATNISLWDQGPNTFAVTDNSGGQFKTIRSYLLSGG